MDSDDINFSNLIFNKANLIFILWFLAIYIISYCLLRLIFKKSTEASSFQLKMSRGIDFIVLIFLFIFMVALYFFNPESKRETIFQNTMNSLNSFLNNPVSIVSIIFFLILFYVYHVQFCQINTKTCLNKLVVYSRILLDCLQVAT